MTKNELLALYPSAQAFLTDEEATNINDDHTLFAVIDRLLQRIEALER